MSSFQFESKSFFLNEVKDPDTSYQYLLIDIKYLLMNRFHDQEKIELSI